MIVFTKKEEEILKKAKVNPEHLQDTATAEEYLAADKKLVKLCMSNFENDEPNEIAKICEGIFDKLAEEQGLNMFNKDDAFVAIFKILDF